MISQEAKDMEPFMEEEVEESILPLMPWRFRGFAVAFILRVDETKNNSRLAISNLVS
jgi:hypothetical protein